MPKEKINLVRFVFFDASMELIKFWNDFSP